MSEVVPKRDEVKAAIAQGEIKQLQMWQAHSDVIRAIQYINVTDEPLVFTAGLDRMACIWALDGKPRGRLAQGYMMKANYKWEFALSRHEQSREDRRDVAMGRLKDVRTQRLAERTYSKQAEHAVARLGNQTTSLGFAGATLVGTAFRDSGAHFGEAISNGAHSKPASYVMNKQ